MSLPPQEPPRFVGVIAFLLIGGVALSAAILLVGLALFLVTGRTGYHDTVTVAALTAPGARAGLPHSIGGVLRGALELRPFAIIELGALVLIATPVVRVAASILLFAAQRDYLFVAVTVMVLGLLLASLFLIR
ncbi:MAG: DUF1634 domain-containing protein [Candidatus Limnocylindria bacterium]